jgi:hypothetical protein
MTARHASCRCGNLRAAAIGEPVRISVCHCLECQQRTGSAFSAQARWPGENVTITGEATRWSYKGESGGTGIFRFCPTCGATIAYTIDAMPGLVAIPLGAFADPGFPAPRLSVWEERKHSWVAVVGTEVEHFG